MITLARQELERFADWLAQEIASDELLLPELRRVMPDFVVAAREQEINAQRIVERKLRSIDPYVI